MLQVMCWPRFIQPSPRPRGETGPRLLAPPGRDTVRFGATEAEQLFPGGAGKLNFYQGYLPDCQTLVAVWVLSRNPAGARMLESMIKIRPEGGYVVTFPKYPHLPVPVSAKEVRRKKSSKTVDGELGVRVLEVAYARLMKLKDPEKYASVRDSSILKLYDHDDFHYDERIAIQDMSGWPVREIFSKGHRTEVLNALARFAAHPDRYVMTAFTKDWGDKKDFIDKGDKILSGHTFGVESVDPVNQVVSVRDPHNTKIGFHFTYDTFFEYFEGINVGRVPAGN